MEMGYLYLQNWLVYGVLMYIGKCASHMECLGKTSQLKNDCFGRLYRIHVWYIYSHLGEFLW